MTESDVDATKIPEWPSGLPVGPFGWRDNGGLTFLGTLLPTADEIDGLAANAGSAEDLDELWKRAERLEQRIRTAVHALPWQTADHERLYNLYSLIVVLQAWVDVFVGAPGRLRYGLLLAGGWRPFASATFYLEAGPPMEAELNRRAALNPISAQAAAVAVAMTRGIDGPPITRAIEALKQQAQAQIHLSVRPLMRGGVPLVELLGQIALTLTKKIDTTNPARTLADGSDGKYKYIPRAIALGLQSDARRLRRQDRRGLGDDAPPLVFEQEVEIEEVSAKRPDNRLLAAEERGLARRIIRQLCAEDSAVARTLELHAEGVSQVEIAAREGITTRGVRKRLNRARKLILDLCAKEAALSELFGDRLGNPFSPKK